MISDRARKIDEFFNIISNNLAFSSLTPTNLDAALASYKRTKKDPQFTYDGPGEYLSTMLTILKEINLGDTLVERVLEQKRQDIIRKIRLLESVGTDDFQRRSVALYQRPSKYLVEQAYETLTLPSGPKHEYIPREEAKRMILAAFRELGFKWNLRSREMLTSARVNPSDRTLELRKKERFSKLYVRRLIAHEIGVHAIRGENARLQPLKVFLHGLANYLETEEGMAAYAEEMAGVLDNTQLRNYAGRVVAVNYGLTHSFHETNMHLRKYFKPKAALKLTLRVKRGLSDTSHPGAYTKDALYFRGYLAVKRYVKKGGTLDRLFVGKIGIKDLPMLEGFPGMVQPKYLPFTLLAHEVFEDDTTSSSTSSRA